ncbi:hypothetical protein [Caballeronia sp. J97]|uniref:hypothetical protein n=1 Tax=Caballeronia sp. J97 TaxID=2805429 RepID=UPI002AB2547F|nr:hypothetical protein [Caballeronia sp. J97]
MSGRFSFRHRLVQCPRCRRQVGAYLSVCPHCDFHRTRNPEPDPVGPAPRIWLRPALVIVIALLASFRPRG